VKDKDAMKKTMIEMSHKIGNSQLTPEVKGQKLTEFFDVNKTALSILGPDTFLAIKNEISDILRRISREVS
jgi:hypothetical protein